MVNDFLTQLKEKLSNALRVTTDYLNEQEWFQELKEKWDDIDPKSKTYLQVAAASATVLSFVIVLLSSMWNTASLRAELLEKRALLTLLQESTAEIAQLQALTLRPPTDGSTNTTGIADASGWPGYLSSLATTTGLDSSHFSITGEKGGPPGTVKESLIQIELKHINLRQLIRYSYSLESGQRPVKLRNLLIDTQGDESGYLNATLAVSAFTLDSAESPNHTPSSRKRD